MLRYAITDRRRLRGAPFMRDREDAHERTAALVAQAAQLAPRAGTSTTSSSARKTSLPQPLPRSPAKSSQPSAARTHPRPRLLRSGPFIPRTSRDEWGSVARRPRLLINSRADVALAVRADGVHLTSTPGELTPAQIRTLYASAGLPAPTHSLSCHTLAEVNAAISAAPDLILFGPVFEKRTGDQLITAEGSGLDLLRQACAAAAPIPVLALGGITAENTPACLAAGAAGIAAIRLFSR